MKKIIGIIFFCVSGGSFLIGFLCFLKICGVKIFMPPSASGYAPSKWFFFGLALFLILLGVLFFFLARKMLRNLTHI